MSDHNHTPTTDEDLIEIINHPYHCYNDIAKLAASRLKELSEENERLDKRCRHYAEMKHKLAKIGYDANDKLQSLSDQLKQRDEEIEELQLQVSAYGQGNHDFCERITQLEKALKEVDKECGDWLHDLSDKVTSFQYFKKIHEICDEALKKEGE